MNKDVGDHVKLTELQKRFVDEYLIDPTNATAAYIKAGYKAKGAGAHTNSSRMLLLPHIQDYMKSRMKDREKRTEITQDAVLQHWWAVAHADPNEIMYHRLVCCRYCFGYGHEYQWIDSAEFESAVNFAKLTATKKKPAVLPTDYGGYGFDRTIRPHPKCPKCKGEGHGEIKANDTRDLSPRAKLLYAGVKQTQAGFEIKMQDQEKAWENIARHLGMFNDKLAITADVTLSYEDRLKRLMSGVKNE